MHVVQIAMHVQFTSSGTHCRRSCESDGWVPRIRIDRSGTSTVERTPKPLLNTNKQRAAFRERMVAPAAIDPHMDAGVDSIPLVGCSGISEDDALTEIY